MDIKKISSGDISTKRVPIRSKLLPPELLVITESRTESGNNIGMDLFDDNFDDDGEQDFTIPWDDISSWKKHGGKNSRIPVNH